MMKTAAFGALVILGCNLLAAQAAPESARPAKLGKIYHVGGDVKPPRAILSPQPVLDDNKERIREESAGKKVVEAGSTILSIVVGEDGSVRNVKVFQSLKRDLDEKAIDAVRQWKFEPATKNGVPVAVELAVKVDFHLYK
jgi:periplasmic protein TonB